MAYVGRGIDNISNASILDTITFTNSAGPYNLEKGSAAFTPISAQALVISVDGVIQAPDSYTISAATITFGVSMASSLTNDFIVHNGVGLITEPSDGSVTTAKIEDLAVTAAKLATDAVETAKIKDLNVTAGKLAATQDLSTKTITLPASVSGLGTGITNSQLAGSIDVTTKITGVVPTANLGSGSASSSTFLRGDQTYAAPSVSDIAWQSVVTAATLTAVAGRGYPINTTSNACTVTLPASASVGDQIIFTDYARNFATNALTINPNSLKYQGNTTPQPVYDTAGESIHIVYMDVTKGWIPINDGAVALETPQYSGDLYYLVVAGGGGSETTASGSGYGRGGAGAGGMLTNQGGTAATLVDGNVYTVVVGAGGTGGGSPTNGSASSITGTWGGSSVNLSAAGGGYGTGLGKDGGNGSGGGYNSNPGGSGDTPSTTPAQGNDGGDGTAAGGGGGGHAGAGANGSGNYGGAGGAGTANDIIETGTDVTYAGGGGGGGDSLVAGGAGGGGAGANVNGVGSDPVVGTDGLGGGAGGVGYHPNHGTGVVGGNGIVVLRVPTDDYSGTTTGSPTITTNGTDTVMKFLVDGSYTG